MLADYAPPLDRLIVALKFGSDLPAAQALGRLLAERARQQGCALPGLLVPVPLAPRRLARRGYNQSERLARTLAGTLGLDLASQGLLRTHETAPQSGLTLKARRHNLDDAFSANRQFFNCDVGLVDDVMTSGATLQVIAATLKQAGARRVVNLVVARTP
ncbi:MAG: ComF family protein [Quisquiliibacterium sp.]